MNKISILLCLLIGLFGGFNNDLVAQTENTSNQANKYFVGGSLSIVLQGLENFPDRTVFISDPTTGFSSLINGVPINRTVINVNPYFGFKFDHKRSLGISIGYLFYRDEFLPPDNSPLIVSNTGYSIGGFYRNDFQINEKLVFFLQPNIVYNRATNKVTEDSEKRKTSSSDTINAFAQIGAKYNFNEKWAFLFNISSGGYSFRIRNQEGLDRKLYEHDFDINLNLSNITIGVERTL